MCGTHVCSDIPDEATSMWINKALMIRDLPFTR
jgi:hypothetical protein